MYKYEIPIFWGERDFGDVIKYVHNKQAITFVQLNEVDSVKNLCKMRDGDNVIRNVNFLSIKHIGRII